jgi:hypothetical protein
MEARLWKNIFEDAAKNYPIEELCDEEFFTSRG